MQIMDDHDAGYQEGLVDAKNIVGNVEQDCTCNRNLQFANAREEGIEQIIYNAQKEILHKVYNLLEDCSNGAR